MVKHKTPKPKRKNLFSGKAESAATLEDQNVGCFLLSLKHFDREQGQTFGEWEELNILAQAIETLHGYSSKSLIEGVDRKKFTIYGGFPPDHKTEFFHPRHVPPDAQWARIHVNGLICLIGHVERNVFHLVFLDKDHKYWKSEKRHT